MEKSSMSDANTSSYQVKNIEPVMAGSDVRAPLHACPTGRDSGITIVRRPITILYSRAN
jgi:hypothetical protein